jgi:hypothetical protein
LSLAVAETVTVPDTLPPVGEAMLAVGGVVSEGGGGDPEPLIVVGKLP